MEMKVVVGTLLGLSVVLIGVVALGFRGGRQGSSTFTQRLLAVLGGLAATGVATLVSPFLVPVDFPASDWELAVRPFVMGLLSALLGGLVAARAGDTTAIVLGSFVAPAMFWVVMMAVPLPGPGLENHSVLISGPVVPLVGAGLGCLAVLGWRTAIARRHVSSR